MKQLEQKLLLTVGVAPSLADFLNDAIDEGALRYEAKKRAKVLINAIDGFVDYMLKDLDPQSADQQHYIETEFLKHFEIIK